LRVAPPANPAPYWDDVALMRREHAVQPYLAALGHLVPPLLFADFTHQALDRDYMFQEYRAGEQWEEICDELEEEDELALWRQCGAIVRQMHDTTVEEFGWPAPGPRYGSWAELVADRLERIVADLAQNDLETNSLLQVIDYLKAHPELLAAVQRPRLLHGDLWRFNLLINRAVSPPQIVALLDADRAWWGDPLADWIIFLLAIRRDEEEWEAPIAAFCESYGPIASNQAARQRLRLYKAMHFGTMAAWYHRQGDAEVVQRALGEASMATTELLNGI
jgi:aminoglycoside phosphotransferase (APT) family kinase protein